MAVSGSWRRSLGLFALAACSNGFIIQKGGRSCSLIPKQSEIFPPLTTAQQHDHDHALLPLRFSVQTTRLHLSTNENKRNISQDKSKPPNNRRRANSSKRQQQQQQQRDVVIIGGGLAGLSAALYLSQIDSSRHITILDRDDPNDAETMAKTAVGSMAAAGMLAPQSERLAAGPLLDLCLASRAMYPDFCDLVESLARESGSEGIKYLTKEAGSNSQGSSPPSSTPWSVGYMHTGGFLAPAMAGDSVATWAPPADSGTATWLDATQVRELEPNLHPNVVGGWWFPQDASVDARRLTKSLRAACVSAGVQLLLGSEYEISSLDLVDDTCQGIWLASGKYLGAKSVLVANGAWMRNLLPVPIQPHKGQSLSLRMPSDRPPILRRVIFAQDSYIVPKADGRIVIGATVEAGSFDSNVTPAGLLHILSYALELVPGLKDLPIEETWAGLRPTTPDKGPILGSTPWQNLYVAGGYWRNGVLLAPKTGELMAQLIAGEKLSPEDETLINAFAWDRFTETGAGATLAANARYAASMHPVQSRTSGFGIAASVGTELGSYSTARSAAEERGRDRSSLFGDDSNNDESFERAARMGKEDSLVYSFGEEAGNDSKQKDIAEARREHIAQLEPYGGSADAFTVTSSHDDAAMESAPLMVRAHSPSASQDQQYKEQTFDGYQDIQRSNNSDDRQDELKVMREAMRQNRVGSERVDESQFGDNLPTQLSTDKPSRSNDSASVRPTSQLDLVYQRIKENKAKQILKMDKSAARQERPDPGFRIYFADPVTNEQIEVPPYTSPGEFQESLKKRRRNGTNNDSSLTADAVNGVTPTPQAAKLDSDASTAFADTSEYSEKTFDGYQSIQELNSRTSRQEELEVMREARRRNRLGQKTIDENKIGAARLDEDEVQPC